MRKGPKKTNRDTETFHYEGEERIKKTKNGR